MSFALTPEEETIIIEFVTEHEYKFTNNYYDFGYEVSTNGKKTVGFKKRNDPAFCGKTLDFDNSERSNELFKNIVSIIKH